VHGPFSIREADLGIGPLYKQVPVDVVHDLGITCI